VVLLGSLPSQAKDGPLCKSPPPDNQSVQVFLTASGSHDSPVTPTQSELSVPVDKQPAQLNTLRAAKSDVLLFAVVVDTSRSDAGGAALIKKAALELFQGLSTGGNQGYLVLFNVSVAPSRQPLQVSQVQDVLDSAKFGGGTAVYDAIEQTCIQKLSRSGNPNTPRRVILLKSLDQKFHSLGIKTSQKELRISAPAHIFVQ
jgi:hypothetical protein